MTKTERLNDMMRYLNDCDFFNLADIMTRYDISKRTAIRDIQDLEALGMPIKVEHGRYGRYAIERNSLLSPLLLNLDEVYAAYIAMLFFNSYPTTPFHLNQTNLKEKVAHCLSEKQLDEIKKLNKIITPISNDNHPSHQHSVLPLILQSCLNEQICHCRYGKNKEALTIQFFNLTVYNQKWLASGFDTEKQHVKQLSCEAITDLTFLETNSTYSLEELIALQKNNENKQEDLGIYFEISLSQIAAQSLKNEQLTPNMTLIEGARPVIKGHYLDSQEDNLLTFLLSLGSDVLSVQPVRLRQKLHHYTANLLKHYQKL